MTTPTDPKPDEPPPVKAEALRADFSSGSPLPTGMPEYKTKLDAAIFGAKVFILAAVLALLLTSIVLVLNPPVSRYSRTPPPISNSLTLLGTAFYIALIPSVFFGLAVGFTTHRLATGDQVFTITPWWQWILLMLCCYALIPLLAAFWIQTNRRKRLFLLRRPVHLTGPVIYLGIALIVTAILATVRMYDKDEYVFLFVWLTLILYFAADGLIVNRIALWGHARQLAPRHAKFQFTLGHMMAGIFIFAAYLTGFLKLIGAI